jgi:hypothetical protein
LIFEVARWVFVGVFAFVALFLLGIALLTAGISVPFAALFGWLALKLAQLQPTRLTGSSRWTVPVVCVPAGAGLMILLLG